MLNPSYALDSESRRRPLTRRASCGDLSPQTGCSAYFTVIARPLRSALTIAPTELPESVSTAPCPLVSMIACAPRPMAHHLMTARSSTVKQA